MFNFKLNICLWTLAFILFLHELSWQNIESLGSHIKNRLWLLLKENRKSATLGWHVSRGKCWDQTVFRWSVYPKQSATDLTTRSMPSRLRITIYRAASFAMFPVLLFALQIHVVHLTPMWKWNYDYPLKVWPCVQK